MGQRGVGKRQRDDRRRSGVPGGLALSFGPSFAARVLDSGPHAVRSVRGSRRQPRRGVVGACVFARGGGAGRGAWVLSGERGRGGLRSRGLAGGPHARGGLALRAPSPRSPGDSALRPRRRGSASSLDEGLLVRAQLALYDGASNGAKRPHLRDLQIHDRRARSLPPRGLLAWCDLRAPRTLGRLDRSPRWREGFFRLTLPRRDPDPIRQRPRVRAGSSRFGRGSAASPPLLAAFR